MKHAQVTIQISRVHLAAFAAIAVMATGGIMVARAYTPGQTSNGLPLVIPYQGTLSRDGQPFNGNQSMTFALHDSATGGVPLWTSNLRNVDVVGGKFAVTLGDSNDTNEQLTPADFQQNALYVSVNIDGAELLPRQRFAPAPQAITAAQSAGRFDVAQELSVQGTATLHNNLVVGGTSNFQSTSSFGGPITGLSNGISVLSNVSIGTHTTHSPNTPVVIAPNDGRHFCALTAAYIDKAAPGASVHISACYVRAGGSGWYMEYNAVNGNIVSCEATCMRFD